MTVPKPQEGFSLLPGTWLQDEVNRKGVVGLAGRF